LSGDDRAGDNLNPRGTKARRGQFRIRKRAQTSIQTRGPILHGQAEWQSTGVRKGNAWSGIRATVPVEFRPSFRSESGSFQRCATAITNLPGVQTGVAFGQAGRCIKYRCSRGCRRVWRSQDGLSLIDAEGQQPLGRSRSGERTGPSAGRGELRPYAWASRLKLIPHGGSWGALAGFGAMGERPLGRRF